MFLTCVLAIVSVAVGAAVGASHSTSSRYLRPIRAAGLGSGCLAVFAQLMPEAAEDLGLLAIVPFAVALFASTGIERAFMHGAHEPHGHAHGEGVRGSRAAIELGFLALATHQLVEGVAMGALQVGSGNGKLGVVVALSAHTIPLVAVFTLAISRVVSRRAALVRAALLGLAGVVGVVASGLPQAAGLVASYEGWIHGAIAGLLLHAILHAGSLGDHEHKDRSWTWGERVAAAGGALLVVAGVVVTHGLHALEAPIVWVVVALSIGLSVVAHRAFPHGDHLRSIAL